jgi:hypothetical protein
MTKLFHKELSGERWFSLSLPEQMANIGSEVYRTIDAFTRNDMSRYRYAFERTMELYSLTLSDKRWKGRYREIARSKEFFVSLFYDSDKFKNIADEFCFLNKYFLQFGVLARNKQAGE